jgi:RNA polymerase sigma factor (sigma-70 family)
MEEKTELELINLAQEGDKAAFGELVRRYQTWAHRIARRLISQDACAQELVQESMLQAYLSIQQLRDAAHFKGWICGIVLNVCRSYLRDQKTVFLSLESMAGGMQMDASALSAWEMTPEEMAEEQELHQVILDAVNALSIKDREITLSFYYQQLSAQEIAVLLKISVGAVRVRLHRARQHLKEKMLSHYAELIRYESRRKKMVKVKISDVIKTGQKDAQGQSLNLYVIVLVDEANRRAMPVWVGPFEGQSIAMEVGNLSFFRPLTFNFFANLLKAVGATMEEVRIETLKENIFYSVVKIKSGTITREVDARPSDAMALALLCDCPILVAEDVLARASVKLPDSADTTAAHAGIDSILEEIGNQRSTSKQSFQMSGEEIRQANQKIVTNLYAVK